MEDRGDQERLEQQGKGDRRTILAVVAFAVLLLVAALGVTAYEVASDPAHEEPATGTQAAETTAPAATETQAQTTSEPAGGAGADLFVANCGSCHTLSAADTTGTIGPNLDDLQPDEALVLSTIQNGAGGGLMPANLVSGAEAQQVAAYVAASAGN